MEYATQERVLETLKKTKSLIDKPEKWVKNTYHNHDKSAYCLTGAIKESCSQLSDHFDNDELRIEEERYNENFLELLRKTLFHIWMAFEEVAYDRFNDEYYYELKSDFFDFNPNATDDDFNEYYENGFDGISFEVYKWMDDIREYMSTQPLARFNDDDDTTHGMIIYLLDRAIKNCVNDSYWEL